jgi:hypothetical protein
MVNSKNSLNLKKDKNTFQKSISLSKNVDGIVKKENSTRNFSLPKKENFNTKEVEVIKTQAILNTTSIVEDEINNPSIDDTKRMFLKVAGVAGLGLAASALFPKSSEAYISGSTPTSNVVGIKNIANAKINPATEDGNLANVKTNTDSLLTSTGGAYIRQDSTDTIAKESGGNLAAIKTNTDNLSALKTNTDKFKFDGDNLLISGGSGGGGYEIVGLKDLNSNRVNPATDDAIVLLRRMVKLMESQATTDAATRQRITVDSLGALGATMPVSGTVALGAGAAAIGSVTFSAGASINISGQNQQIFQDPARTAYATGIRNNLLFT